MKTVRTGKGSKQAIDQEYFLGYNNRTKRGHGLYVLKDAPIIFDEDDAASSALTSNMFALSNEAKREEEEDGLYVVLSEPSLTSYREHFREGDPCVSEEDGTLDGSIERSVEVHYVCSEGISSYGIVSVQEVQTCAYVITVSLPNLCFYDEFHTTEVPSFELVCDSSSTSDRSGDDPSTHE